MENEKVQKISQLQSFKEGLENLGCVLSQCVAEGDWGLFEENSQLQLLWRRFCSEIFKGHTARAVLLAKSMLQIIDAQQVAANFWAAVKSKDYFSFELSFRDNYDWLEEIKKSIKSGDGMRVVQALNNYLERALQSFTPNGVPGHN